MSTPNASASDTDPAVGDYEHWVGRVIDERYRIDGLLGEGGMGAVFVAEHLKLMKKVAIKVIHPEFAGDGDVAERFIREAMTAAQMEHPHVASATDYGTIAGGGGYLVMQYVEGKSLRDLIDEEGALGWVRACEIAAQVADALAAAHAKGYVHRDLKPDNVMLQERDDGGKLVKVLDFGIARVANDSVVGQGRKALTRVGTVIGTPGYMSPEQALGEPVDYRADIYALGLLVHEMITGTPVYEGLELTAIVTRQLTDVPPRLNDLMPDAPIPKDLDDIVVRMLARERDQRHGSAADARDMFRSLLLEATIQRVASGEHDISSMSTAALAGAADGERASVRRKAPTPPPTSAGTVAGKASARGASPTPMKRSTGPVATAKTSLALEQLGKVKEQVERAKVPLPLLGAAGCGAVGLFVLTIVVLIAAFSGDETYSDLPKLVHERPVPGVTDVVEQPSDPEPDEAPVPPALAQASADLLISDERRVRRRAARQVLDHQPAESVPEFLRLLALIEDTTRCQTKRDHVLALGALGDGRALPALERMDAEPRDGCSRFFRRFDCYQCMREELAQTIETLNSTM